MKPGGDFAIDAFSQDGARRKAGCMWLSMMGLAGTQSDSSGECCQPECADCECEDCDNDDRYGPDAGLAGPRAAPQLDGELECDQPACAECGCEDCECETPDPLSLDMGLGLPAAETESDCTDCGPGCECEDCECVGATAVNMKLGLGEKEWPPASCVNPGPTDPNMRCSGCMWLEHIGVLELGGRNVPGFLLGAPAPNGST